MSTPAITPATNLTRRGNQTNNTGQPDSRASSIAFAEPYCVLEHGWFADCLICGGDIEHGDTCQRVLTVPAAVPTPDWVHEDCPDHACAGQRRGRPKQKQ